MKHVCKYDPEFKCICSNPNCLFSSLVNCLKIEVSMNSSKIEYKKFLLRQKHDEMSYKWRKLAFFYKKELRKYINPLPLPRPATGVHDLAQVKEDESI